MSKEEKIDKILEMTKEIMILSETSDKDIDDLYKNTKIMLGVVKKAMEDEDDR